MQIDTSQLTDHWSSILLPDYYSFNDYALKFKEFSDFWNNCQDGRYLLLWAGHDQSISRQQLIYAACQVARLVLPLIPEGENRPRMSIETAERWCKGKATTEEVEKAVDATYSVATFAAAAAAAASAAGSAVDATYSVATFAAAAASAAGSAAYTDDNTAGYPDYSVADVAFYAAHASADKEKMKQQTAKVVRENLPMPTQLYELYLKYYNMKTFW
jgi:hypothetical protein